MATVFDVAKYILYKKGEMSTWKLQKLCFYAQAWSLAWTEHALFNEDFQAWANGPVCPELFHVHKGRFSVKYEDITAGDLENLNSEESDTINVVLDSYGDMEPYYLREMTHNEAPWKNARIGLTSNEPSANVISKASMGEYYGSL